MEWLFDIVVVLVNLVFVCNDGFFILVESVWNVVVVVVNLFDYVGCLLFVFICFSCRGLGFCFGVKFDFVYVGGFGMLYLILGYGLFFILLDGMVIDGCGISYVLLLVVKIVVVLDYVIEGEVFCEMLIGLLVYYVEIFELLCVKELGVVICYLVGFGKLFFVDLILEIGDYFIIFVFVFCI